MDCLVVGNNAGGIEMLEAGRTRISMGVAPKMKYLVKLITPPNGIVLDPFAGSGSTLVACKELGFGYIGIEKEKEYFNIARKRLGM